MTNSQFTAYFVDKQASQVIRRVETRPLDALPSDEVQVRVRYSSLNYKDALAATGHAGVVRSFPHIPGIDAAGCVVQSVSPEFQPGDEVFITGFDLGAGRWGGWSEYIRVPADWLLRPPVGLSLRDMMILGTAGFTAAQCVAALEVHGIRPDQGEIVVTGATGGVGILSVRLLAKLGYQVVAVTGKPAWHERLRQLGAARVADRAEVCDTSAKPLLPNRWAGAVDTVGGATLVTLLRQLKHRGCVTACGLVGGTELPLTVYPFLLRGVTLAGIDSAWCPISRKREIWQRLANEWRLDGLDELTTTVTLRELDDPIDRMLRGEIAGRVVVSI